MANLVRMNGIRCGEIIKMYKGYMPTYTSWVEMKQRQKLREWKEGV